MNSLDLILESTPLLVKAVGTTIQLWLSAAIISLIVGILFGIWRSKNVRIAYISSTLDFSTFILRGIPFYVQLLLAYFVVPDLLGINLSAFSCAVTSLGLCSAAYVSQIIRAGIDAISQGQWEAATVLGYSKMQALRYVIMPQVLRSVLPSINGELDQLLKSTSILSSIGVLELTRAALNIISIQMQPIPVYLTVAGLYLMISTGLNFITNQIERRLS
jgi:His/Glu/Gln/Arg/opine family amino acid ABC transporter permease subunit